MPELFVSVGSNIEPRHNIGCGLARLRALFGPLRLSPVYESRAMGFSGDNFLNLVLCFASAQPAATIYELLHRVEGQCGRRREGSRFAPRTLDLDLLLYGDQMIEDGALHLPRAEILRYAFVLRPLADLAGERRHPAIGSTFAELWQQFDARDQPSWPVALAFPDRPAD